MLDGFIWAIGCKDDDFLDRRSRKSLAPGSLGLKRKGGKSALYIGEEEWRLYSNRWMLFPVAPGKMTFDLVVMLAVVYSCVVVPYRTVFEDEADGLFVNIEAGAQALFILDVILNFNTAFLHQEHWIVHRPAIARNYLKGWFWIDAPASLPLIEVYSFALASGYISAVGDDGDPSSATQLSLLRAFRLFRLLRLLKMFKLGEAIRTIEATTGANLEGLTVLTTVVLVLAFTHVSACMYYFFSASVAAVYPPGGAWVAQFDADGADGVRPIERYVISLLWAVGTVTGLASTEVTPINHAERIVTVICYVLSGLAFAFIIAVVTTERIRVANDPYRQKMAEVGSFCRFHRVPRGLQEKLHTYFESMFTNTSVVQDDELIVKMTPALQDQVWSHILASTVQTIELFNGLTVATGGKAAKMFGETRKFHVGIYESLSYVTYSPSERILHKGVAADTLFFLRRGEIYAVAEQQRRLYSIGEVGAFVGERCLLDMAEGEDVDFDARTRCDIFCLSKSDLLHQAHLHLVPKQRVKLAEGVLAEVIRKAEMHIASLRLLDGDDAADALADELTPLEASLEELQSQSAHECLSALADAEQDADGNGGPSKQANASLKVQAARMGDSTTTGPASTAGGEGGGGKTAGGAGLEAKVAELDESVKGMLELLQQVASSQAEIKAQMALRA